MFAAQWDARMGWSCLRAPKHAVTPTAPPPHALLQMDWDTYCTNPLSLSHMCKRRKECCRKMLTADWLLRQ